MSRRLVVSSEAGNYEIDYSTLSLREINHRIRALEKKYGTSFARFSGCFSCSDASQDEMTDVMDWECLVEEKAGRLKVSKPA